MSVSTQVYPRLLKAKQDIYYLSVQNRIEEYVSMLDNYSIVLSNRVDSYNTTQYKHSFEREREGTRERERMRDRLNL